MTQEFSLILYNITTTASIIILLGLALFVFLNSRHRESNIALSFALISVVIFFTSHLIGINIKNSLLSRSVLLWNVSTMFILTFNLHAVVALFKETMKIKWLVIFSHLSVLIISILFFIFPNLFLLPSQAKMYFPNYYEPGPLNWVRLVLPFLIILPYILYLLIKQYRISQNINEKKRIGYFIFAMIAGYILGFIPNFLVYGIQIDPLWGAPTALFFAIPFIYGAIQYNLFNIKIIAKQAFIYSITVLVVGTLIAFLNYLSRWLEILYPQFPLWSIYLISALSIVTLSVIIWQKMKENDFLKYEFITTVTHKFRTPLTVIKWATENLSASKLTENDRTQITYIQRENSKLVELTNLLIKISRNEKDTYEYRIQKNNISNTVDEVVELLSTEAAEKNIAIDKNYNQNLFALFDKSRTNFVLQVLIENAIRYSPKSSMVSITLEKESKQIVCKIKDYGMGIDKNDLSRLFNRFYRGKNAKLVDTEGMGIGLSISKEIIENQGGKIWTESKGENQGSIFAFSLPSK